MEGISKKLFCRYGFQLNVHEKLAVYQRILVVSVCRFFLNCYKMLSMYLSIYYIDRE